MEIFRAVQKYSEWRFHSKEKATVQHDYNFLLHFSMFVRNKDIEDVDEEDVTEYIRLQTEFGYKRNGMQNRISAIRSMFDYLKLKGENVIDTKLITTAKKEWTDVRVIPEEAYRELLSVIPDLKRGGNYHKRNRAMIMLLWDCGCRAGELASIKTDDMDTGAMSASIKTEKNRSAVPFRNIFWTEETNKRILEWKKRRERLPTVGEDKGGYFFCQIVGDTKGEKLTVPAIGTMLRKYAKKNNMQVWNAHSFRHAFGERMAVKGAEDSVISSLMGHGSTESSYRYTRLTRGSMAEKYRELVRA
jgi:site-specific recombinase XerD